MTTNNQGETLIPTQEDARLAGELLAARLDPGYRDGGYVYTHGRAHRAVMAALVTARAQGRSEGIEEAAKVVDWFVELTHASPYWEERTTKCLEQIPVDIRALGDRP